MGAVLNYLLPKNPVTGNREVHLIPSWLERAIGGSSYISLVTKSGGEVDKTKYSLYVSTVEKVGKELASHTKRKDLEFEFKVIDSKKNNACCLPGGKIGINVGLIENMEKETESGSFTLDEKIAAVLSHEIIHADARHTGRSLEIRLFFIGIVKAAQAFALHLFISHSYQTKIEEAKKTGKPALEITKLEKEKNDRIQQVGALFELISGWIINSLSLCNSRSH